jgi:hypothetical protein
MTNFLQSYFSGGMNEENRHKGKPTRSINVKEESENKMLSGLYQ